MDQITVRQMDFDFPDDIDPIVVPGDPEESYFFIAFSLLLPYLEPYLIRTMKDAKRQVTDPKLREDLEKFNAQEGQHFKQHVKFNEVIRSKGFPRLRELEERLEADYRRFSRTKSLQFNLAYAEGFEAFTTQTACFSFEQGFGGMHPALKELYAWHLVEELEHRTVAFDVYDHVCGGYLYRLCFGLYAQWHMLRWTVGAAAYMLEADPQGIERFGGRAGLRARRRERLGRMRRHLLPNLLRTYGPRYTPHDIPMPEGIERLQKRYTARAVRAY